MKIRNLASFTSTYVSRESLGQFLQIRYAVSTHKPAHQHNKFGLVRLKGHGAMNRLKFVQCS